MFKKILVVFTTTTHTEHTYEAAFEIGKKFDSEIRFVKYIIKEPPKFGFFETSSEKIQHKNELKEAQESLTLLEDKAKNENLMVTSQVISTESFAEDLISYVESNKVDLAIIDIHSLGEAEELEHKDLIHKIFKNTSCPILTLE